jgi:hypothetical protein
MTRARKAAVAAVLGALALAGCSPGPTEPTPSPTPSVQTPTETPEERQERLDYAAAEKAYRTFRAEYGRVLRAGGAKEPTRVMKETAGGEYLKEVAEIVRAYKGLALHSKGAERIVYVHRVGYSPESVSLEVCEDSSKVVDVDRDGKVEGRGELRTASLLVRRTSGGWKVWTGEGKKASSCEA